MSQTDYTPFNRKKNYNKGKRASKIININHYHSPIQHQPNIQDVNNASDMIDKYALNKPIITTNNYDRYTPMPRGYTPMPPMSNTSQSPTDRHMFVSTNVSKTVSAETDQEKLNKLLNSHRKYENHDNEECDSDMENETSIIYTFNDPSIDPTKKVGSPSEHPINMIRIIRGSPQISPNRELAEIIAKTERAIQDKYNRQLNQTKKLDKSEKPEQPVEPEQPKQPEQPDQPDITKEDEFEEIIFTDEIKNVKDLIKLSAKYPIKPNTKYSINLHKLHNIVPHLIELDEMVGMDDIKTGLANQLMYFLQDFEYTHMLHTIIEGPPGVGKTCLGKILGKIYLELNCINTDKNIENEETDNDRPMNILFASLMSDREKTKPKSKDKFKFKVAKRSDFVGQYVGHTAIKTQKLINECFGGVLFIDEAYSLGADDPFSKECINTLNQNLSENGDKFICIIAGYADSLESNFFSYNSGLSRRFPFRYSIPKYTGTELTLILKNKINKETYTIDDVFEKSLEKFIDTNKDFFPNFGGDIETLFFQIKMMHAKRVFGKAVNLRKIFNKDDIVNGLTELKKNQKKKEDKLDMYN